MNTNEDRTYFNIIDPSAKIIGMFGLLLYIWGFIIINSYLSNYGFHDYNLASPRFIFTGGLYALMLTILWIGVGRKLLTFGEESLEIMRLPESRFRIFSRVLNLLLKYCIYFCFCTLITSLLFFEDQGMTLGLAVLFLLVLLPIFLYSLIIWRYFSNFIFVLVEIIMRACLIFIFLRITEQSEILGLVFNRYSYLVSISFGFYEMFRNRIFFNFGEWNSAPYFVVVVFFAIVGFGGDLYSHALERFGGPINRQVDIYLKNPIDLPKSNDKSTKLSGKLLYQTEKISLLIASQSNILLNNDEIRYIDIISEPKSSVDTRFTEAISRIFSITSSSNNKLP